MEKGLKLTYFVFLNNKMYILSICVQSSLVTTPPTATDIALIRESWNVAKTIPTIPTNTLIE